ncbi:phage conserved hypothetical protein BR0599 [Pseudooceanicola antarcticus]|uniref:Bacteriophage phiJL001 Gp84 C-terminal domain-containing protein n=1 Tax=Pseudooceanicola antarcticus TaxID=1247613 RepID=A0A285J6K7_9RHOB|nr:DUF2163 domain-containing protein [Pseudooceanicola antarcticus]PJE26971.1 hypothetical protein CVM39_16730 [Pseudooceanicola antarcticus]SNY55969.1 phage conserved hypothetical protein BR0599 [Pseudooceanicola antarcticus]
MAFNSELAAHLQSGATTTCHAWAITRTDGVVLGFTDHDRDLSFEGITFRADTGLSAAALQQGTGLSVDNSEAIGALSYAAIREEDIEAGRFDGAGVVAWLVNWASPEARQVVFRGSIGELTRAGGAFRAELRGLSEVLNQPMGRIYQKPCAAVLGGQGCGVDLAQPGYRAEVQATGIESLSQIHFPALAGFAAGWFSHGRIEVLDGPAEGLSVPIKQDRDLGEIRQIELWTPLPVDPGAGALFRLEAGCDKRFATCRAKFDNALNFQGFPDIPGEDWVMVHPSQSGAAGGGSRR